MDSRRALVELRESVRLLIVEWWLFAGLGLAYVAYGLWVVATGVAVDVAAPELERTTLTAVAGVGLSATVGVAVVAWLVLPALVAVALLNRRLHNSHGNLVGTYRLHHPSVLLAVPGVALLCCLVLGLTVGRSAMLAAVASLAAIHLLFRTVAYGYRVYTLSSPRLLSLLAFLTAATLAAGWLVHVTVVGLLVPPLDEWTTKAGVDGVVRTGLALAGVNPAQALLAVVAVPVLLSLAYLLPQFLVGSVVRARAPLANPQRRPDQRFPVMPPTASPSTDDDARGASPTAENGVPDATAARRDDAPRPGDADDATATAADHSGTRVFGPSDSDPGSTDREGSEGETGHGASSEDRQTASGTDPSVGSTEVSAADADDATAATDDTGGEWLDDTAVFSPDEREPSPTYCADCGETVPPGAQACPSCGAPLDG